MNVIIEEVVSEFPVLITEEIIQIKISGSVSYFELIEVSDTDFVGKDGYVPIVDEVSGKIILQPQSGGGSSLELGETSTTAYRGDRGKIAYDHSQFNGNPHGTTASQVGAYTKSESDNLLDLKADLVGGLVPSSQLPAYVDDVLEGYLLSGVFYVENTHVTPIVGEIGKIYVDLTTGQKSRQYRWSGSVYIQITNGLIASTNDVPEGTNLYFTTARVLSTVLSGLSILTGGEIVSTDTVLQAFGKIQTQLDTKISIETPATTGVALTFATDRIYGSIASPETGNITASTTGAKLGVTNIIIHNSGTAPTFDSKFKKLSGSGSYVISVVNYIYCTYITSTEIIYSINQRT